MKELSEKEILSRAGSIKASKRWSKISKVMRREIMREVALARYRKTAKKVIHK